MGVRSTKTYWYSPKLFGQEINPYWIVAIGIILLLLDITRMIGAFVLFVGIITSIAKLMNRNS